MIENVKAFPAELKMHALADGKVLEETHVVVGAFGQAKDISTGVAIGETAGQRVGVAVVKARALLARGWPIAGLA